MVRETPDPTVGKVISIKSEPQTFAAHCGQDIEWTDSGGGCREADM